MTFMGWCAVLGLEAILNTGWTPPRCSAAYRAPLCPGRPGGTCGHQVRAGAAAVPLPPGAPLPPPHLTDRLSPPVSRLLHSLLLQPGALCPGPLPDPLGPSELTPTCFPSAERSCWGDLPQRPWVTPGPEASQVLTLS